MKISEVRTIALSGATQDTGWPSGTDAEEQTGVPYIEDIIDPPFRLDADGMLRVPTGPGLGVRLNPDALARCAR